MNTTDQAPAPEEPGRTVRVVVCDDSATRVESWADRVRDCLAGQSSSAAGVLIDVQALTPDEFNRAVRDLKRRKALAKLGRPVPERDDATVFDNAEVLMLDSDLTPDGGDVDPELLDKVPYLVGELGGQIAHLARGYTRAGAIVVINQKWKSRTFDLTMQEFADGAADVFVTEADIAEPGLWFGAGDSRFRPWSWPRLLHLPELLTARRREATLDAKVLAALGLDEDRVVNAFDARQLDSLGLDDDPVEMTFRDVADNSNFGYRLKEEVDDSRRLTMAVSGVYRWLDRVVLPSQSVLIDRPHLMQAQPWVTESRGDLASWNDPRTWWDGPGDVPPPHPGDGYAREASRWLGRHVWLAPHVLPRPRPAHSDGILPSDPVFCEDTSQFTLVADAHDFESDLPGQPQRFVARVDGVSYTPAARLLR